MKLLIAAACEVHQDMPRISFPLDQAIALKSFGHDVRLVAVDIRSIRKKRKFGVISYQINQIPICVISLPCGPLPTRIKTGIGRLAASLACRCIRKDHWTPEVVHAHTYDAAYFFAKTVRQMKVKYVVTEHSSLVNRRQLSPSRRAEVVSGYQAADAIIAVSSALADSIHEFTGFRTAVVPNVLDEKIDGFAPHTAHQTSEKKFVFVAAGNLIKEKGYELLLQAFAELKNPKVKLVIYGQGPCEKEFRRQTEGLGIQDRVSFQGWVERAQLFQDYQTCDCFVLPSYSETFGVAYLEALAMGLPVIATACGGPSDFINQENGILIPVGDREKLVSAMKWMMENVTTFQCETIAEQTRNTYSSHRIAKQLSEIYAAL